VWCACSVGANFGMYGGSMSNACGRVLKRLIIVLSTLFLTENNMIYITLPVATAL
jgi:hypothetical protein